MKPLIPLEQALQQLLDDTHVIAKPQVTDLGEAKGLTLSAPLVAAVNVPGFDNSAVDGYALRFSDLSDSNLNVNQRIAAGDLADKPLASGCAARIFTGAKVPPNADTVVMQEDCVVQNNHLSINAPNLKCGSNIRPTGQDTRIGDTVLHKGDTVSPVGLALAASQGACELATYTPLKVAYFSTGDELVEPGHNLLPGQIFNSNRYLLKGLIEHLGMEAIDLGKIEDSLAATQAALERGADQADVILTTGGASVGEEDHVRAAIESLGQIDFWRIAIKPGKPFIKGVVNGKTVLGLPGNPSAVLATFTLLARPLLLKAQGSKDYAPHAVELPLGFEVSKPGKRREFLRVQYDPKLGLRPHPNQSSGMMSSAHWADGLAEIAENRTYATGELVRYYSFASLWHK